MDMSQSISKFKALQGCFAQVEGSVMSLIAREMAFEKKVKSLLDESVERLCHPTGPDAASHFRDTLVHHSNSLKDIEFEHQNGLDEARNHHQAQLAAALQQLCSNMIKIMGPELIRSTLEGMPQNVLKSYLPGGLIDGSDGSSLALEANFVEVPTVIHLPTKQTNTWLPGDSITTDLQDDGQNLVSDSVSTSERSIFESERSKYHNYTTRRRSKRQRTSSSKPGQWQHRFRGYVPSHMVDKQEDNEVSLATPDAPAHDSRSDKLAEPRAIATDDSTLQQQKIEQNLSEENDLRALEAMALKARRSAQSERKQLPPFVQKLCRLLELEKNDDLIRWSAKGDSFIILNEDVFARKLIPEFFNHNNFTSFIRQLNTYGFYKRASFSETSIRVSHRDKDSKSEYHNPLFLREHPNLLWLINKSKRRMPKEASDEGVLNGQQDREMSQNCEGASIATSFTKSSVSGHDEPGLVTRECLISLIDASENVVGTIEKPSPWSPHVREILQMPVVRSVKLRPRRVEDKLAGVCNRADPGGSKILACMIQAGGTIMQTQCSWCRKGQGPFEDCIILDGTTAKCGNCKWTRHGCEGATVQPDVEDASDKCDSEYCSDSDSCIEYFNANEWRVYQIKSTSFSSDTSMPQRLRWSEEKQHFKHQVLIQSSPGEIWRDSDENAKCTIALKEICRIEWNAKAMRVHFVMNQPSSKTSKENAQGQRDIMVTFDDSSTVRQFRQFCDGKNVTLVKRSP